MERKRLSKEINENNIYLLLKEKVKKFILVKPKTLSQRYPEVSKHHSFDDWSEYLVIQLPKKLKSYKDIN